jgi:hypothetical protein
MLQIVQMCFGEQFRGESRASRIQFVLLWFLWIDKPFAKQYPFKCLHPISYCIIRILVHQVRQAASYTNWREAWFDTARDGSILWHLT